MFTWRVRWERDKHVRLIAAKIDGNDPRRWFATTQVMMRRADEKACNAIPCNRNPNIWTYNNMINLWSIEADIFMRKSKIIWLGVAKLNEWQNTTSSLWVEYSFVWENPTFRRLMILIRAICLSHVLPAARYFGTSAFLPEKSYGSLKFCEWTLNYK